MPATVALQHPSFSLDQAAQLPHRAPGAACIQQWGASIGPSTQGHLTAGCKGPCGGLPHTELKGSHLLQGEPAVLGRGARDQWTGSRGTVEEGLNLEGFG